jgi:hypothetical protein
MARYIVEHWQHFMLEGAFAYLRRTGCDKKLPCMKCLTDLS